MAIIPFRDLTVPRSTLTRIQHGMYSTTAPSDAQHEHYLKTLAAVQRRQSLHVASHITAAVAHRLPMFDEDLTVVHLTSSEPSRRGVRAGVQIHEGPTHDAIELGGVLVTPLSRTLIDCAKTLPRDQAVAMVDYALHHGLTTKQELLLLNDHLKGWRTRQVRNVISLSDGLAESVGETRSRLILLDAGIKVRLQVPVRDQSGLIIARIDMVIEGTRMGIEFEGREKARMTGDSGRSNKERNDRVEDLDWIIVPVYWEHVENPQLLLARVRRGLKRARTLAA